MALYMALYVLPSSLSDHPTMAQGSPGVVKRLRTLFKAVCHTKSAKNFQGREWHGSGMETERNRMDRHGRGMEVHSYGSGLAWKRYGVWKRPGSSPTSGSGMLVLLQPSALCIMPLSSTVYVRCICGKTKPLILTLFFLVAVAVQVYMHPRRARSCLGTIFNPVHTLRPPLEAKQLPDFSWSALSA